MSTVLAETTYSPEDLLTMRDGERFELVEGQLVERHMSYMSSHVAIRVAGFLQAHCENHPCGWIAGPDASFRCFLDAPHRVRRPDVSFICFGRFPGEEPPEGHITIAPDLAVEVLSPNDLDYETDEKVDEYLAAGVRLVWVVNPEARTVLIYRSDGSIEGLREKDELSGEDVVPGFRCQIAELFKLPKPPS